MGWRRGGSCWLAGDTGPFPLANPSGQADADPLRRRCEDIVWLKTNTSSPSSDLSAPPGKDQLFTRTLEHCLMGIRGTVRRSSDGWFAHCNVSTDVLVWPGDTADPSRKPPELQSLVEEFCQGTRRLEVWGTKGALRRGWLTVGEGGGEMGVQEVEREEREWQPVQYDAEMYRGWFSTSSSGAVQDVESTSTASTPLAIKVNKLLPFVPGQSILPFHPRSR